MINTEKIERLKAFFRANPRVLSMGDWEKETNCGTVGCFAGWACMLEGESFSQGHMWAHFAAEILGFTNDESINVFYCYKWPDEIFNELSKHNPGTREYAEVVCDAIDYFTTSR